MSSRALSRVGGYRDCSVQRPCSTTFFITFDWVHLAVHHHFILVLNLILVVASRVLLIVVLFVHLGIRGRECRVDILWTEWTLPSCSAVQDVIAKCLLYRPVLVECAANEIS